MSAGAFVNTFYSTDKGGTCNMRVQPETLTFSLQGTPEIGPADQEASVKVQGSRRSTGIIARKVRVRFTGTVPTGYLAGSTLSIPILTQVAYAAISKGDTGTYLGSDIRVLGKTPEYVN